MRGWVQKQGPSAVFTHKAIIKYITHVHIFAQFLESLLDFWHNHLNILINMQFICLHKSRIWNKESSVPTCCKGYILEQGFYCIVFYIKIYTQCINVWKDSTNVKLSPVYCVPFKAGVLQPHTGKSSQKTKETAHLDVLGEPVLDPKTNIKKQFHL